MATGAPTFLKYSVKIIVVFWGIDCSENFTYTDYRTLVRIRERRNGMSTHEAELFKIIYENDHPEKAVLTAIQVFTAFLEQLEAVPEQPAACLQGYA